jgi:hypothetical protein
LGAKQRLLAKLLAEVGVVTEGQVAFPNYRQVAESELKDEVDRVYHALGGKLAECPVNFKGWDIEFDGVAVELDEERHFNLYRALTLRSEVYSQLPAFPLQLYRAYCTQYQSECLAAGDWRGNWTNARCEKQFGMASTPGSLDDYGAPRWKQRAFYDFVKDLSPLLIGVPVVRISIWDTLADGETFVKTVLEREDRASASELVALVRSRAGG